MEPKATIPQLDDDREVPMVEETDIVVLPDQTTDDEPDWSETRDEDHELRLFEERPPHWEA